MSSDRASASPFPRSTTGGRSKERARAGEIGWRLDTDWPEEVPVTRAEAEVVERFLGDLLDELLGGNHAPR